jgi:hypothetical protein
MGKPQILGQERGSPQGPQADWSAPSLVRTERCKHLSTVLGPQPQRLSFPRSPIPKNRVKYLLCGKRRNQHKTNAK